MRYRRFGKLGWNISEIGFGAWAIGGDMWGPQDDKESVRALHRAIDLGVNFIDTAAGYGKGHSEEIIGKVLKERPADEIFVATKVPPQPGNPWPPPVDYDPEKSFPKEYIIAQCEGSLKRLGREYIDVYQFHTWASRFNGEGSWMEATALLKAQGKIRAVGVSVPDTTAESVIGSLALGTVEAVQVIYNIFDQFPDWNLFPVCRKLDTAVIVRVPFDEGALTGKYSENTAFADGDFRRNYFRGNNLKAVVDRVEDVKRFKDRRHPKMPMAEYALRFCLSHEAVSSVIPGMRNVQQAEVNLLASDGSLLERGETDELKRFRWRKDFWHEEVKL